MLTLEMYSTASGEASGPTGGVSIPPVNAPGTEADGARPCIECVKRGCPTEGMTFICQNCHEVVCNGHAWVHEQEHNDRPEDV